MWTRINDIDRMFHSMDLLHSRMNRLFSNYDRPTGENFGWRIADGTPRTNLYDQGSQLEIIAEVPGINKDELNIKIQGNYLEISGVRNSDSPEGYKAHRVERGVVSFSRSFTLPTDVDAEKATASLKNGVLRLILPKVEEAKPKQISIN